MHRLNLLTVIASEGYADFVRDLQKNISDDLYDRPKVADIGYFLGKTFTAENGTKHSISEQEAKQIYKYLLKNDYIDNDDHVTETYRQAASSDRLVPLPLELEPIAGWIHRLVQGIWNPVALKGMIDSGCKPQTPENKLNENFSKKEFQELWNRINHKYAYTVDFDSNELIEKAVMAIDRELNVSQLHYVVTRGEQKVRLRHEDVSHGQMLREDETEYNTLHTDVVSTVKYDLLGKIAADTRLTRRTIATILQKISATKFNLYQVNPEEFIRKVSRLILEQKATIIVDHITYNQVDGEYSSEIFTQEKHSTMDKAYEGKKSIVDYVFTDGSAQESVERQFVQHLDSAREVVVYAKLPKGFHIPTPVGNYSPDWAIAFQEGSVKHIYFVAETKGSMSSLDLREIERGKIACAEKLFEQLSTAHIRYGKVDSFDTLMQLVNT